MYYKCNGAFHLYFVHFIRQTNFKSNQNEICHMGLQIVKIKDRNRSQTLRHGSSNFYKEKLIVTNKICLNMLQFPAFIVKENLYIFFLTNKRKNTILIFVICSPPASHILFLTDWKGDRFLLLAMARNFLELRTSVSVTLSLSPLQASRHNTNWYRPFFFTSFFFFSSRLRTSGNI